MRDIIVPVMAVRVGVTSPVALGYILFGLWGTLVGLAGTLREDHGLAGRH